jgi:hypothetical protein
MGGAFLSGLGIVSFNFVGRVIRHNGFKAQRVEMAHGCFADGANTIQIDHCFMDRGHRFTFSFLTSSHNASRIPRSTAIRIVSSLKFK